MSISLRRYGAILASSSTLVCYGEIISLEGNAFSLKTVAEPKENGAVRTAYICSHVIQLILPNRIFL